MSIPSEQVPIEFRRFARGADSITDIVDAVLQVERVFFPGSGIDRTRLEIASLGEEFAQRIVGLDQADQFRDLGSFLGEELDFRGERSDSGDPDQAFLHRVLQSRRGLPITLSTLYMGVAAAAGMEVAGIALPGHFVVGLLDHRPPLFLDPFRGGRPLTSSGCDRIVREVTSGQLTSAERFLTPTPPRTLLVRMLNNLQMIFWNRRDSVRGLLAARMLCLLNPNAPDPVKIRAYFYDRLGESASALADYEAYLRRAPEAPDARRIRQRVAYLRETSREPGGR